MPPVVLGRSGCVVLTANSATTLLLDQLELVRIRGDGRAVFESVARSFIKEKLTASGCE